jgi:hypothetical protein
MGVQVRALECAYAHRSAQECAGARVGVCIRA